MTYTAQDKLATVEREVKYRKRVYPRLIASGQISADFARRQIETMEAIAEDYRDQVKDEDLFGDE